MNYRQPYEDIMGSEDEVETSLDINPDLQSLIIQQHHQMNTRIDLLTQRLESIRKPQHEKELDSETENEDHIPGGRFWKLAVKNPRPRKEFQNEHLISDLLILLALSDADFRDWSEPSSIRWLGSIVTTILYLCTEYPAMN